MGDALESLEQESRFPRGLLDWSGNRAGGVRRLFDQASGRPAQIVFETNLLVRLRSWAADIAAGKAGTPRIVLLVGGPGNGKTEAIESTVGWIDAGLGPDGRLVAALRQAFAPGDGIVPRLVTVDLGGRSTLGARRLSIVQDATARTGTEKRSAARLLLDELQDAIGSPGTVYLACVNRGVLDDALIDAIDDRRDGLRTVLEAVTAAVALAPDAPSCWPLANFPEVGVWPMDAESLLVPIGGTASSPVDALLGRALDESCWAPAGTCAAGPMCPHCQSRDLLSRDRERSALRNILRWHEVASGKRWNFRDLFSLASYLLAGHATTGTQLSPCKSAARLADLDDNARRKPHPSKESSTAIFHLLASQYQHALFHSWNQGLLTSMSRDLRDLELKDDNTAMGLYWFLQSRRTLYLPSMIADSVAALSDILDPALADPDTEFQLTQRTSIQFRDLDIRFSRSVREGLDFIRQWQVLTRIEAEVLARLGALDDEVSRTSIRRRSPQAAARLQRNVRDFASRVVRRSIGARVGIVRDGAILAEFERISGDDDGEGIDGVAREVEKLLNTRQDFEVSLTTTFGQPMPPARFRALLVAPPRQVRASFRQAPGRPRSPLAFLSVGSGTSARSIALTFDLFKAVKELELGMSAASLPRSVSALLDATRARLAGPIVRDPEILDRASIRIGVGGVSIEERRQRFLPVRGSNR